MFKQIEGLLTSEEVAELNRIADSSEFVDGRVSNPHNQAKQNLQLHDPKVIDATARKLIDALMRCEDFRNFAFPRVIAPPIITAYRPGMKYGLHPDAAFMQLGKSLMRSDISCTVFLSDPASYDGGELHISLGEQDVLIKMPAGSVVLYPSNTLHQVREVTRGERRVGLTFIESRIVDPDNRELLYELNEVAALEGLNMDWENYVRLQRVQMGLLRKWAVGS
ncbi:Fe2+-dependent dioxygenase [Novosphingobium sp. PC22D]|uniref:Fe2+-dependent dioxygenase n=1 Tax=Novosphingobium sp. PC22D TaxID=1962403 RepID=UPI000BF0CB1A|nr:Fe2+-dependent dioxygenase [Novosphingobium sp. PC22D]PEQ12192.1 Fe2+-dependent dioxygenase [Novosphingobium sp. PC22D]